MKTPKLSLALLGAAFLIGASSLVACDDTEGSGGAGTASTNASTGSGNSTGSQNSSSSGNADAFVFATDTYDKYTQIDRHGAVEAGTVGILATQGLNISSPGLPDSNIALRDDYNASNPEEDISGKWLTEIGKSVDALSTVLDDDIKGAMLTPCRNPANNPPIKKCLEQAGPVIVPDTIKYDPSKPTAYPNGRKLTDQVVDITIAAALLDLSVHPLDTLAKLGLNPKANDVPFKDEFPFLAPPH
ncbi:MAG: DUF4331 family protein [Polyangiaceae bacterium]